MSASSSKGIKRPHKSLSIAEKVEILKKLDAGTSVKNICINYGVGSSTIYDIKKQKSKILEFYSKSDTKKGMMIRKSMKEAANPDVDNLLMEWFRQRRAEGFAISGAILMEQAKVFHSKLNIQNACEYSTGWLHKFKKRHGISMSVISGEKLSADKESADDFIDQFEKLIKDENLSPENIYNADETALFWRCLPKNTLVVSEDEPAPSGFKDFKDRLTILVCSNAAGTHKLKLLVIGKSNKPRAFKGIKIFPAHYRANKRGWMTSEIMLDWFDNCFMKESRRHASKIGDPNGKILLILDNCAAHPDAEIMKRENVSVLFLPPNCTSLIQPQDQGIIRSLKCRYRADYMKQFLSILDSKTSLADSIRSFNIKDAMWILSRVWENMPQTILFNCWKNLWPSLIFHESENRINDFEGFRISTEKQKITELTDYAQNCVNASIQSINENDVEEWFNIDKDAQVIHHFTDDELIASLQTRESRESDDSDVDEGMSEKKIPINDCIDLGRQFVEGLEQYDFVNPQQLMNIHAVINELYKEKQKRMKQTKLTNLFKENAA